MKNTKTALVIGATGLVGKQVVNQLLAHPEFSKVIVMGRRSTGVNHPKLEEILMSFDELNCSKQAIKADVLFSCLGTTIRKAKTKENQYKVDFTYQFKTAEFAAKNGTSTYVLVSSAGANSSSRTFYSRIKGELEEEIIQLPFQKIRILRPSLLLGNRTEFRLGEKIGIALSSVLTKIIPPLKKYRGIKDSQVARAMIASALNSSAERVVVSELDEIFEVY